MRDPARHLARPPGDVADRRLGRALDHCVKRLEAVPGDRGLERVVDDARGTIVRSRAYGIRMNAVRQRPPPPGDARRPPPFRRPAMIGAAFQRPRHRRHRADGPPTRSPAPSPRSRPSPAPVLRASLGSSMRQFAGYSPDCEITRRARIGMAKSGNHTAPPARNVGRACTRIQASVMIPSTPSEPRNSRSGLGPAPEPGRRRVCTTPAGVTTRRLSTKSSICVKGWRNGRPSGSRSSRPASKTRSSAENAAASARAGAIAPPAPGRTRRPRSAPRARRRSTSSTRSMQPQIERDRAARAPAAAVTPPTTQLPAPNGITCAPAPRRPVQHSRSSCSSRRIGHHVRRVGIVVEQPAQRVGIALAESVRGAIVGARSSSIRPGSLAATGAGPRDGSRPGAAASPPRTPTPRNAPRSARAGRTPRPA